MKGETFKVSQNKHQINLQSLRNHKKTKRGNKKRVAKPLQNQRAKRSNNIILLNCQNNHETTSNLQRKTK